MKRGTPIVVVGGASNFEEFTKTFSQYIGLPVDKPLYPDCNALRDCHGK